MAQVIALSEIHRTVESGQRATDKTPAKKPVVKVIKPGTVFLSEGEELEQLRKARAVRDPEKGEKVAVDLDVAMAMRQDSDDETGSAGRQTTRTPRAKNAAGKPKKTGGEGQSSGRGAESGTDGGSGDGSDLV